MVSIAFWSFPLEVDTDPDHTWIILPSSQQSSFFHMARDNSPFIFTLLPCHVGLYFWLIPQSPILDHHFRYVLLALILLYRSKTQRRTLINILHPRHILFIYIYKYINSYIFIIQYAYVYIYKYCTIYIYNQYRHIPVWSASYFIYLGTNLPGESPISEKPMRSRSVSGKNARVYCHIWSVKDG